MDDWRDALKSGATAMALPPAGSRREAAIHGLFNSTRERRKAAERGTRDKRDSLSCYVCVIRIIRVAVP